MLRHILGRRPLPRFAYPQLHWLGTYFHASIATTTATATDERDTDDATAESQSNASVSGTAASRKFNSREFDKVSDEAVVEFMEDFAQKMQGLDLKNFNMRKLDDFEQRLSSLNWNKIGLSDDVELGPEYDEVNFEEHLEAELQRLGIPPELISDVLEEIDSDGEEDDEASSAESASAMNAQSGTEADHADWEEDDDDHADSEEDDNAALADLARVLEGFQESDDNLSETDSDSELTELTELVQQGLDQDKLLYAEHLGSGRKSDAKVLMKDENDDTSDESDDELEGSAVERESSDAEDDVAEAGKEEDFAEPPADEEMDQIMKELEGHSDNTGESLEDGDPNSEESMHQFLEDLGDTYMDEPLQRYVNLAGSNRPGWHFVAQDRETCTTWWALDLTGGKIPSPERNALLSNEVKDEMYAMHKEYPEDWTVARLANLFKIRQQRVMAILALKELEEKADAEGEVEGEDKEIYEELRDLLEEEVWDCIWEQGTGERHVRNLPSQPNFELRDIPAGSGLQPGDVVSEVDAVQDALAEQEERILIKEFKQNLDWNLGKTGKTITRASRAKHLPKRPDVGWSLLVKPIGGGKPYVAQPDGSRRDLTQDENLYLQRMQPKKRRKII